MKSVDSDTSSQLPGTDSSESVAMISLALARQGDDSGSVAECAHQRNAASTPDFAQGTLSGSHRAQIESATDLDYSENTNERC